MSVYTSNQQRYIDVFMRQIDAILDHFLKTGQGFERTGGISDALDKASDTVAALSNVATVAGSFAIVATGGSLLAPIGAGLAVLNTGKKVVQFVMRHAGQTDAPFSPDEIKQDQIQLSLRILLREVAYLIAVRYSHFIDKVLEEKSIDDFARYGSARLIRKLAVDLKNQVDLPATITAQHLVDYLLASIQLSAIHEQRKVTLRTPPASSLWAPFVAYAKWGYARPRQVVPVRTGSTLQYKFYGSPIERMFLKKDTTLPGYGYITVPETQLLSNTSAINYQPLKELSDVEIDDKQGLIKNYLCYYLEVTFDDVDQYLSHVRALTATDIRPSLNDYLSKQFGVRIIAECHDDKLKDLDLHEGDFTEVNFSRAILKGNLYNTLWDRALLAGTLFDGNKDMTNANFQQAYAEQSKWQNLSFTGNFTQAKLSGAKFKEVVILASLVHIDCRWDLVEMDGVTTETQQSLKQHFEEQLNSEHQAREASNRDLADKIQQIKTEQDARLDKLEDKTKRLSGRLSALEPIPGLFGRLRQYWDIEFNTPALQDIKKSYVELNTVSLSNTPIPLSDRLDQFLAEKNKQFFLVHGEIGSGKSLSATLWQEELMNQYEKSNDWLPVYIKLKRVHNASIDNFLWVALETVFNNEQIDTLMKNFRCLIIFDGLDECSLVEQRFVLEECVALNDLWKKGPPKILLMAETRYLFEKDYHELLRLDFDVKFSSESECVIQSFTDAQVTRYLSLYDTQDVSFSARYSNFQDHELAIRAMAKSPIMLHIICEVLRLHKGHTPPSTRLAFYDAFFRNWYDHVKRKLSDEAANYDDFEYYIQELAKTMFELGQDYVDRPYPQNDRGSLRGKHCKHSKLNTAVKLLFENPDFRKIRHLTPLTMTVINTDIGDESLQLLRYEFTHPSFEHYALSGQLLNVLLDSDLSKEDRIDDWNYGFLTDAPGVLDFLHDELITHKKIEHVKKRLLEMVFATKNLNGQLYERAASNAITLLNRLGFDFSNNLGVSDLVGIHIPKADMNQAPMAFLDTSFIDASDACFHDAVLVNTSMKGGTLAKTRFLDALSFIYPDVPPETFAVCPSSSDDRIAYDVTPKFNNQRYKIAIARVADGEVVMHLDGHQGKVRCMDWTTSGGYNRIASAGEGGTIRVWDMSNEGKQIAVLQVSKGAILTLAWSANGNLLAFGGEDKTVQIWDINNKKRLFLSDEHGFSVQSVIWGHKQNILISGGDDNILRLGVVKYQAGGLLSLEKITQVNSKHGNCIYSLALSPDDQFLASGCANGAIYIREIDSILDKDPKPPKVLSGHTDAVTSLAWNATGLVSASNDNTVRIWDVKNQQMTSIFQGHDSRIKNVAWLPNGRHVISGGGSRGRMLSIWNSAQQVAMMKKPDYVAQVTSLAPRGDDLAVGSMDGRVVLWAMNQSSLKRANQVLIQHEAPIQQVGWSIDGSYLASLGNDKTIRICEPAKERNKPGIILRLENPSAWFNYMTWLSSPNHGHWLAAGASDGAIYLWDIARMLALDPANGELLSADVKIKDKTHKGGILSLACSSVTPDLMQLAASNGRKIMVWELDERQYHFNPTHHQLFKYPDRPVVNMAWSPDGRFLASTDDDGVVYIWNTTTWAGTKLSDEPAENKQVFWTTTLKKQWLVSGSAEKISLWDATDNPSWAEPQKQIPWGANIQAFSTPYFIMARNKGIYMTPFMDLVNKRGDHGDHPCLKVIHPGFWAQKNNLLNTINLASSTERFMQKNGAITTITSVKPEKNPRDFSTRLLRAFGVFRSNLTSQSIAPNPVFEDDDTITDMPSVKIKRTIEKGESFFGLSTRI